MKKYIIYSILSIITLVIDSYQFEFLLDKDTTWDKKTCISSYQKNGYYLWMYNDCSILEKSITAINERQCWIKYTNSKCEIEFTQPKTTNFIFRIFMFLFFSFSILYFPRPGNILGE